MLDLQLAFVGCPDATHLHHLLLHHDTLVLYPSADAVVILNARSLALVRVLAFGEAFPGTSQPNDRVSCISVDSGMKLIVAAMNTRVAVWSLSGTQNDTWRIHSSLVLPEDHAVTTLDCNAGLLAVGSQRGLSVYTLILENDLLMWSQKWMHTYVPYTLYSNQSPRVTTPSRARFAPSMMYIATTSIEDNVVRIFSTTTGRLTQHISHPRPVTNFIWRHSITASRDDLVLYTITSDSVLRIFMPVLDSLQYLQLHGAIDIPFTPKSQSKGKEKADPPNPNPNATKNNSTSSIFWLDRKVIRDTFTSILEEIPEGGKELEEEDARRRRAREVIDDGWDLFLRVMCDGSVLVTAVANIDGRPPRFLKQFTLQQTLPYTLPSPPTHLCILPTPTHKSITLITSPALTSYTLDPLLFFFEQQAELEGQARKGEPIRQLARGMDRVEEEERKIVRFVRTPEGKGVGVIREEGGEAWVVRGRGTRLGRAGRWDKGDHVVVLDGGKNVATYSSTDQTLTLHSTPPIILSLPPITSLFSLPSSGPHESIVGITPTFSLVHIIHTPPTPTSPASLTQHPHRVLPSPVKVILPVDPMAWSVEKKWPGSGGGGVGSSSSSSDVLLSVSEEGELAFWALDEEAAAAEEEPWRCTERVKTGRKGFRTARCSSVKKSALVVPGLEGEELTIWDSTESEFASGLEYRTVFSSYEPINDLDWTSTPDNQSILAVGFPHHVELLCQQRMTYFDEGPGWTMCWKISIAHMVPYPISDSIWLANGSLLVGAGHQMFLYGQPNKPPSHGEKRSASLFEYAARHNGPLEDYHPQMLLQCLLWEKVETVKDIIVNLARNIRKTRAGDKRESDWQSIPIDNYLRKDGPVKSNNPLSKQQYSLLFSTPEGENASDEDGFSRTLVMELLDQLESEPLPHLTPNEHAHLLVLIQTTLEIDEQRRALDSNGLRYVISMRSFYILNRRVKSDPNSPQSNGVIPRQTGYRERLRYRDIVWAFHSESQELLLNTSIAACNGKMCWSDARALGIFIWLRSVESMKAHLEMIARNEYMMGDNRDPTECSLFYFALGKVKLVHGLWKQAAWHKEQAVMLKFLSNDFNEPRWRTAALKNAYALLSKQRFEYAAAFFLLGSCLKDAVNVCINKLSDFQLAITLARVVEQGDDGPVLNDILKNTVLPTAFRDGNRWLGSWAFWMLRRRDLAVRILLTPLQDIATSFDIRVTDIGESHYDDPSLALLFSQLKSKTLQAAQGTSEIPGRAEFNFVLQMTRVFCRMGCHVLALDLVRSWSFERPSTVARDLPEALNTSSTRDRNKIQSPSPISSRRSMFPLEPALRRRSTIMIDMEISSEPPTRRASPERVAPTRIAEESINEEGDLLARKAGMGNLMKSAKQDVKVPDFDMNAFF